MGFRAGVDIGGTFTDTVMVDDAGQIVFSKVPSTPPTFYEGLVSGVLQLGRPLSELTQLAHGTTVGINAVIARRGARTAVVTTRGFRDLLYIRRGDREEVFNLWYQPSQPLVPRKHRFEVTERVDYRGDVVTPLAEDEVRDVARRIRRLGLEAVAIVFINSPVNHEHERRTAEILRAELPGVYICCSTEILPEILESERTATTTVNAYIGPIMDDYVGKLESELALHGYRGEITIGTSAGGVATPDAVRRVPARTLESGPAAGVMAAREISATAGFGNVVTFDMGGTSLDLGIIFEGEVRRTNEYMIEWGMPVRFPSVDVFSIGAGGGSLAWIDAGGRLRSGPQSAGARPGPACYGTGGGDPTNSDAQVVLDRLAPASFLGGEMTLYPELAREAIERAVARPLGLSVEAAAAAILAISQNTILQSLRLATVERGFDPREFALFALGGAGPLFAAEIARQGSIPHVIVPRYPGLTSALGLLLIDIRHDVSQSILLNNDEVTAGHLDRAYEELEERVVNLLTREGVTADRMQTTREVDLRYFGQTEGFTIPAPAGRLDDAAVAALIDGFLERQQREFGYVMPREVSRIEFVTIRVAGIGRVEKAKLEPLTTGGPAAAAQVGSRSVWFEGGRVETAIYDRALLGAGAALKGPAIVQQPDSTTVVPPGASALVDDYGNIVVTV